MESEELELQVINLTNKYLNIIGPEHHKDRDCHWYVNKVWSYGQSPYYRVEHYGYIYGGLDRVERQFKTYKSALTFMIEHIQTAIKETESWER